MVQAGGAPGGRGGLSRGPRSDSFPPALREAPSALSPLWVTSCSPMASVTTQTPMTHMLLAPAWTSPQSSPLVHSAAFSPPSLGYLKGASNST